MEQILHAGREQYSLLSDLADRERLGRLGGNTCSDAIIFYLFRELFLRDSRSRATFGFVLVRAHWPARLMVFPHAQVQVSSYKVGDFGVKQSMVSTRERP